MRPIGLSTGALAKSDYRTALADIRLNGIRVVELSALRSWELPAPVADIRNLDLHQFEYVSFHAPSRFDVADELSVYNSFRRDSTDEYTHRGASGRDLHAIDVVPLRILAAYREYEQAETSGQDGQ